MWFNVKYILTAINYNKYSCDRKVLFVLICGIIHIFSIKTYISWDYEQYSVKKSLKIHFPIFFTNVKQTSWYLYRKYEAHNHNVLCVVWNSSSLKFVTMKRFCGCATFCSMINSQFRNRNKLTSRMKNKKLWAFKINCVLLCSSRVCKLQVRSLFRNNQ